MGTYYCIKYVIMLQNVRRAVRHALVRTTAETLLVLNVTTVMDSSPKAAMVRPILRVGVIFIVHPQFVLKHILISMT